MLVYVLHLIFLFKDCFYPHILHSLLINTSTLLLSNYADLSTTQTVLLSLFLIYWQRHASHLQSSDSLNLEPNKNIYIDIKRTLFLPDCDNLTRIKMHTIHLGNKDGRHSLIESSSIHIDGGTYWEHKTSDSFVNGQILLQATECDRKCASTGDKSKKQGGL